MLKEFLLHGIDFGKDFTRILVLVLLIIGVLAAILPVIFNIVTGRGKFKGQPKSERFILFLVATFVMGVLSSFVGLMLYYQVNIFVVGNNISTSGDKAIEYWKTEGVDVKFSITSGLMVQGPSGRAFGYFEKYTEPSATLWSND